MGEEQTTSQSEHHRLGQVDAIETEQRRNGTVLTMGSMPMVDLQFTALELRRYQQLHLVAFIPIIKCLQKYIQSFCLWFPTVTPDRHIMSFVINCIGQVADDTSLIIFQILRNIFFLHMKYLYDCLFLLTCSTSPYDRARRTDHALSCQ